MSTTDRFRYLFAGLFALAMIAAIVGWLRGLDPSSLTGVMTTAALACGVGEASNVGKRWTYDPRAREGCDGEG